MFGTYNSCVQYFRLSLCRILMAHCMRVGCCDRRLGLPNIALSFCEESNVSNPIASIYTIWETRAIGEDGRQLINKIMNLNSE